MNTPEVARRVSIVSALTALTLVLGLVSSPAFQRSASTAAGRDCPPGYVPLSQEGSTTLAGSLHRDGWCINTKHPEDAEEIADMGAQQFAKYAAPSGRIPRGSYFKAIRQRNAILRQGQTPANRHRWHAYGKGPLQAQDEDYPSVNGLGLVELAGRITDLAYVPPTDKKFPNTVFASVAYGGVWKSTDEGKTWSSIADTLPTQIVGSVGYTKARGGTIVVITGDGSFGRYSRPGAGAYWSTNAKKWHHAKGVPSDAFGFNVAVDEAHPKRVYVATGKGLYRSTNAGRSFKNVKLPTGKCTGRSKGNCMLANQVTDVTVQTPGGSTDAKGGAVLAAVGWRSGNAPYANGKPQSAFNGLYASPTGKPGSFKMLDGSGFAPQERIGRVEFGPAIGKDQDHNYVYATVQDAVLDQGGGYGIDIDPTAGAVPSEWNGLYVSSDFGQTWTQMYDAGQAQQPGTGSALAVVAQTQSNYGPGIQSWYDEWVMPDPTKQSGGVPTRVLFGLEEVWMNDQTDVPQNGPSSFHVIGRYFGGSTCLFLAPPVAGVPYTCPTNRGDPFTITNTTHPDQHAAVFIPHDDGSVTLVEGNDGGVYTQAVAADTDFDNDGWGIGANRGFNTLFPYHAVIAGDGTVWMGLQDNGTAKIQDATVDGELKRQRQIETLGGDGFFAGVDPRNSDLAYGEYTYGAMSGTNDGGKTWNGMAPPNMSATTAQFSNPFAVDPLNPLHVMIAGNQVNETASGPGTSTSDWAVVYHLGTRMKPGKDAQPSGEKDSPNIDSAIDLYGANAYVGFCGSCDPLDQAVFGKAPFHSGIATNVGGAKKPKQFTPSGWHIAKARGLPNRYITGIEIDPKDPKTVYVSVGGYRRPWNTPGQIDKNRRIGRGHLFVSHDAARNFTDISRNLPNYPVNFVRLRGNQLVVATDVGVFIGGKNGGRFQVLGRGLPIGQVATVEVNQCNSNELVAAVFGRGVYTYEFGPAKQCKPLPPPPPPPPFLGEKLAGPFEFEGGTDGWVDHSSTSPGWQNQAPGNASGSAMAVSPYQQSGSGTPISYALVGPKIAVPERSSIKITWAERLDTEDCCDFLALQYSTDGHIWTTVSSEAGQNDDFPNFTTKTGEFVAPKGDLYLRFVLGSDQLVASPPYTGVAVDSVLVER